ncbi:MAG: hypothetical protein J2P26_14440, partial [Nocardiopsaceae bacterium]|nr:hypothetical protein [Nocardiopsaceae bacterium]
MGKVVRTLIAALLIAAPVLVAGAAPTGARVNNPTTLSSLTNGAVSGSLTVSIDSVSPNWAQPGTRITVRGTVTNNTASAVGGLRIGMQTSSSAFTSRSAMESYA